MYSRRNYSLEGMVHWMRYDTALAAICEKLIYPHMAMTDVLIDLCTLQGKSQRIENPPQPRQCATLDDTYSIVGSNFVWLSVPVSVLVMWVFHTMERIGRVSENPFEGTPNDVPITTISRGIEIDLREMLDEDPATIPHPIEARYHTQT